MPPLSLTVFLLLGSRYLFRTEEDAPKARGSDPCPLLGGGSLDEEPAVRKRATHRD